MLPVWARSSASRAHLALCIQMDVHSYGTFGSSTQFILSLMVTLTLTTPYGLLRLVCLESMLCGCNLPSLHPLFWSSGQSSHPSQRSVEFWFMQSASILSPVVGMLHFILTVSWIQAKYFILSITKSWAAFVVVSKTCFSSWPLLCVIYILMWRRSFSMQIHLTSTEWFMLDVVCLHSGALEKRFSLWCTDRFTLTPQMGVIVVAFLCTVQKKHRGRADMK